MERSRFTWILAFSCVVCDVHEGLHLLFGFFTVPNTHDPNRESRVAYLAIRPSDQAIQRILDDVGEKIIPHGISPGALAFDLAMARMLFERAENLPFNRSVTTSIKRLEKMSERLLSLMKRKEILAALRESSRITPYRIYEEFGMQPVQTRYIPTDAFNSMPIQIFDDVKYLRLVRRSIADLANRARAYEPDVTLRRSAAFKVLITETLPSIYQQHFKRKLGTSRSAQQRVMGPGIRFIQGSLREMGIKKPNGKAYGAETIARYLSFSRRTKSRT